MAVSITESWKNLKEKYIIGLDEAGRGCLAGPVYAGAVLFQSDADLSEIRDSKELSEKRREEIYKSIISHHRVGIGIATPLEIEKFNILNASLLAMKRAFENLKLTKAELESCHALVDGNQKIKDFNYSQTTVIQGDKKVKSIAAASIVAKVLRDKELRILHEKYPQYQFDVHKGYATEIHRTAIAKFGPCPEHRKTFAGVKEYCSVQN
jgi:ribonuclease HII